MSHARLYWYHIQSAQLHIEGGVAPEERGVGVRWRREEKTWGRLSADGGDLPWFRGCFPLTAVLSPSVLSEVRSSLNVAARFHSASLKNPPLCTRRFESPPGTGCARGGKLEADIRQVSRGAPGRHEGNYWEREIDNFWWIDGTGRGCWRCSLRWFAQGQVGGINLSSI